MKIRTLIILLAMALLLAVVAAWVFLRQPAGPPPEIGQRVLRTLDINQVARMDIASGTQRVSIVRGPDGWAVANRWNFPARFEMVSQVLRGLDGLRVAEIIHGGTELLAEFGLDEKGANEPARIELFSDEDRPLEIIALGQPRTSPAMATAFVAPDSRYARVGRGPVILAEPFLEDVRRRPSDWINDELLNLPAAAIHSMTATPTNEHAYGLTRTGDGTYAGFNTLENKPIDTTAADSWFGSLQRFTFASLVDPTLSHESLGREMAEVISARTTNGLVVRVELGPIVPSEQDRYAWLSFEYEGVDADAGGTAAEPTNTPARAEFERLQKFVAPWTYQVSETTWRKLLIDREQLIAPDHSATGSVEQASGEPVE